MNEDWDPALDQLLSTPVELFNLQREYHWSDKNEMIKGSVHSFLGAINTNAKVQKDMKRKKVTSELLKSQENHIKKMIEAPLSPRKLIIVPGSKSVVKKRDKYAIEGIVQKRNTRSVLSSLPEIESSYVPPVVPVSVRPLSIKSRFL